MPTENVARVPGMETVIATVSGYRGDQKNKLVELINRVGAVYTANLREEHTHVVCWEFSGEKYRFARKCGIKVVNHQWFEHSLRDKFRLPDESYTWRCGRQVGPLKWQPLKTHESVEVYERPPRQRLPDILELNEDDVLPGNAGKHRNNDQARKTSSYKELLRRSSGKRKLPLEKGSSSKLKQRKVEAFLQSVPPPRDEPVAAAPEVINDPTPPRPPETEAETARASTSALEDPMMSQPDDADVSCAICIRTEKSQVGGYLHCGHDFCFKCISKWADQKFPAAKCPLCNAPFDVITKKDSLSGSESIVLVGTSEVAPKYAFFGRPQEPSCLVCRSRDSNDRLLTCNNCNMRAVHTFCLDPPWSIVGPWTCRPCSQGPRFAAISFE